MHMRLSWNVEFRLLSPVIAFQLVELKGFSKSGQRPPSNPDLNLLGVGIWNVVKKLYRDMMVLLS